MAEGDESPSDPFRRERNNSTSNGESETEEPVKLDLGIDLSINLEKSSTCEPIAGPSGSVANDAPRREDNPFSFKHFLRSNSTNYQNQGARPKVYCDGRPISSISDLDLHQTVGSKQTRIVPEFSSALPDFVQDHLVIEQCYLGKDASHNNFNFNLDNLPDFTPNRNIDRLNDHSSRNIDRRTDGSSNNLVIPLDLPVRPSTGFPLDLPNTEDQSGGCRSCPSSAEVGVSKSLPDFLADGAVRSQTNDAVSANQSPVREIDRIRQEMEIYRLQMIEQTRRAEQLQRELEVAQSKEHEYTQNLAKALEQVEENLERSNRRAASAENIVIKLKQEVKSLKSEINILKKENQSLKGDEGAAGGPGLTTPNELHSQRLAHELRAAASTAELSLRQLLTGVDNLRIMAATLENMHRIEERTESLLDLDDDTGPAL